MSDDARAAFEVTSTLDEAGVPVVRVRGDVDMATAPALQHALLELTDQGHSDIVIDLTEVAFMDASGLGVLVIALRGLRDAGGALTLRSTPPQIRLILNASGLEHALSVDAAPVGRRPVSAAAATERVSLPPAGIPADVARMGSIPASNAVVDASLRMVTRLATEVIEGADGVSVSLHRHGHLVTVAASNETIARMDVHQYATDEGPCISASRAGRTFHIESLGEERRWSAFVPRAMEEGISSILSEPLLAGARPIGALNIYSSHERVFGRRQQELAALLATQASAILEDAAVTTSDGDLDQRILRALRSREVIAQAQGVVMARKRVTEADAADILRRSARRTTITVLAHSQDVVASTQDRPDDQTEIRDA